MRHLWRAPHIEFNPHDLWVGVYWEWEDKPLGDLLSVYLCIVPCFPLSVTRLTCHD